MYPCYRSHKHAPRTSYRYTPCFLSGSAVLEREIFMYYVYLSLSGRLLDVGIAKLSLLITLCASCLYSSLELLLHRLNSLQTCPLSETRRGDSFSNNVSPEELIVAFVHKTYAQSNIASSAICYAKNASPRAMLSTRKIFSSYDWLLPNPVGTARYVSRSKNNLRGITCGIRLVWGMDSLP